MGLPNVLRALSRTCPEAIKEHSGTCPDSRTVTMSKTKKTPTKPRRPTFGSAQRQELRDSIKKTKQRLRLLEADLRSITPKRTLTSVQKHHKINAGLPPH